MRYAAAIATLFAFWVLLSGYFTPFLLGAGVLASIAVVAFAWRMNVIDHEGYPIRFGPAALWYWPWLAKEIVKSAWDVSRVILDPRLPVSPTVVRVRPGQNSTVGLVTYANSITLTPGTITVEAGPDEFLVHALTAEGAESLCAGDMDAKVVRFEGRA